MEEYKRLNDKERQVIKEVAKLLVDVADIMEKYKRLNDKERQVIKEVAKLLVDVADTTSHISPEVREGMFDSLRKLVANIPMVNGYAQISQISSKINQIIK